MMPVMRPVIIAANWKMNTTPADAGELAATIAGRIREPNVIRVICPPFVCLATVGAALAGEEIAVGAQDVHHELAGAYTGDTSAAMLQGLASWVIIGHSERRRDHGETDERISGKLRRAVEAGLRPILCVGEQLDEREAGRAEVVVDGQLRGALGPRGGRAGHRVRAGMGDRHGPECPRIRRRGDGRNGSIGDCGNRLGCGRGQCPGPVRRQRHCGERRRVPGRAVDRRSARRWCLAQAGRDRGHRRSSRPHRECPSGRDRGHVTSAA